MAKQTINVGTSPDDRTGDFLRVAIQKTNANFTELYDRVDVLEETGGGGTIDTTWVDTSANLTYSVVQWHSGFTANIVATPTEYANLVTYDARTDSDQIYFTWDQTFIDNVWEGFENPEGSGENYEVSFDGNTWFSVDTSGYNGGTFFYFAIPFELQGQYTFTYEANTVVQMRYNRGSLSTVWFDLENAPVDANTVVAVHMSTVANARYSTNEEATVFYNSISFANAIDTNDNGEGSSYINSSTFIGSGLVEDSIDADIKRNIDPADAGRLYCVFNNGRTGQISFYWDAKLYVRS